MYFLLNNFMIFRVFAQNFSLLYNEAQLLDRVKWENKSLKWRKHELGKSNSLKS